MDSKSMQPGATPGLSASFPEERLAVKKGRLILEENKKKKAVKQRYYRKRVKIFTVLNKIKLWPSRNGRLHGIKKLEVIGSKAKVTTHCNREFYINNSINSRAGRWLRNKWYVEPCSACRVPEWKLEKYGSTRFKRHQGALLTEAVPRQHALEAGV